MSVKLSVIIPALNEEANLQKLLDSLGRQTFSEFEVIVADAASVDATAAVARRAGARVVPGGLPGAGRNRGAAVAKGEKLFFVDADIELPDEHFLEAIMIEFEQSSYVIATCNLRPENGHWLNRALLTGYNWYVRATAAFLAHAPGFCLLIKKSVHVAVGGFDETVLFAEDHEYARRCAKFGRFGILKSRVMPIDMRRFERDGHISTVAKYLWAEIYMVLFGGIKKPLFKYQFGHWTKDRG